MFIGNKTADDLAYDLRRAIDRHSCNETITTSTPHDYNVFKVHDKGVVFQVTVVRIDG